jgi:hypothetical protein
VRSHRPLNHCTGYGFGGLDLSKSAKNLISLIEELDINNKAEIVTLVDVHTGLGPIGEHYRMTMRTNDSFHTICRH